MARPIAQLSVQRASVHERRNQRVTRGAGCHNCVKAQSMQGTNSSDVLRRTAGLIQKTSIAHAYYLPDFLRVKPEPIPYFGYGMGEAANTVCAEDGRHRTVQKLAVPVTVIRDIRTIV